MTVNTKASSVLNGSAHLTTSSFSLFEEYKEFDACRLAEDSHTKEIKELQTQKLLSNYNTVSGWLFTSSDVVRLGKECGVCISLSTITRLKHAFPNLVGPTSGIKYGTAYCRHGVKAKGLKYSVELKDTYYFTTLDVMMIIWVQSLKTKKLFVRDKGLANAGVVVRNMLEAFHESREFPSNPLAHVTGCASFISVVNTNIVYLIETIVTELLRDDRQTTGKQVL